MSRAFATAAKPESTPAKICITYIDTSGKVYEIEAYEGDTLMTAATCNSVPGIDGDCGGNCACGTCLIRINEEVATGLTHPNSGEQELLSFLGVSHRNHRLGCQIALEGKLDGMTASVVAPR